MDQIEHENLELRETLISEKKKNLFEVRLCTIIHSVWLKGSGKQPRGSLKVSEAQLEDFNLHKMENYKSKLAHLEKEIQKKDQDLALMHEELIKQRA